MGTQKPASPASVANTAVFADELIKSQADNLVDLVVSQDVVSGNWIKFLSTAQAGLIVAHGYLLHSLGSVKAGEIALLGPFVLLPPIIGVVISWVGFEIIAREYQWSSWYVQQYNALPGYNGKVFATLNEPWKDLSQHLGGYIPTLIKRICIAVSIGWVIALLFSLYALWIDGFYLRIS